jgi:outer membrane protein TolC
VDLKRDLHLAENTLAILLARSPGDIKRGKLNDQKLPEEFAIGFPVQLLRNRPDVFSAEYGLINAFEMSNIAETNLYPSFTITASGGIQGLELDQLFSLNSVFANVIAGLTQPILNGRKLKTQYEVALTQQEEAYLNFRKTILNAEREVSDALFNFDAAKEKASLLRKELAAYQVAIDYSEELLDNGIGNYLEVITARENALNSEIKLIDTRYAQMEAITNLYRALGGGWQ